LSWARVGHPREVLQVGQEVDVAVLHVDLEAKKIALSLKQAQPDPWVSLVSSLREGQIVSATVTKLAKFGAFARIEGGTEGLIHISELADHHVTTPSQVVREGEEVQVKITAIDVARRRLGLSLKQAAHELEKRQNEEAMSLDEGGAHAILDREAEPTNAELQKLAALRFDDEER
ncbi:MAG: S1 RNA-binding domain-containing protein, partial [Chloroflexota bacterium]|nr:S1 RNA-binding domain-containing protein [Chloroflexota bacterium]